ncbi:hypothetical protein E4U12_004929 [Claviceps purpurea]|nr:hypothetical protein E4U12_004929 [Claviceps purpurea]
MATRIEIHKGGLNEFIRTAAATRGFRSDVLRIHEEGELAEVVAVRVPVHVRLKPAGGGGSTDEIVRGRSGHPCGFRSEVACPGAPLVVPTYLDDGGEGGESGESGDEPVVYVVTGGTAHMGVYITTRWAASYVAGLSPVVGDSSGCVGAAV